MLNQAVGNERHIHPATTTSGKSAVIGQNTSHDSQSAAVISCCAIELPKTLNSLQLLRAWAALVVVVVHLGGEILYRYGHWPLPKFTQAGGIGVDVFFCLSGFIMYFTSWRNFGASGAVRVFLWRRLLRIYPVYWIVTLMTFLVSLWPESHMNVGNASISRIIKSVFLLPQDDAPFVGQAWTLVHEIRFYSIFGFFLLFNRANAMWALSVWAAASMCVLVVSYINQPLLDSRSGFIRV